MIGCEKLCGKCEACAPLVFALEIESAHPGAWVSLAATTSDARSMRAILDPASLADLLARALRGRGVDVAFESNMYRVHSRAAELVVYEHSGNVAIDNMGSGRAFERAHVPAEARSALSRLLAAGLCSADEALRLLEGGAA